MTSNKLFHTIRKDIQNNYIGKEEFQMSLGLWEKLIDSEDSFNYTVPLMILLSKYKLALRVSEDIQSYSMR